MTDLSARLREVIGAGRSIERAPAPQRPPPDADRILGGAFVEHASGRCLVIDRTFRPSHYHGDVRLDTLMISSDSFAAVRRLLGPSYPASIEPPSVVFIDLETTGLAGGAGTHAFLVGLGWFDGEMFCTRQLLLDQFRDEPALLDVLADALAGAAIIASFNGKTFDVPLIDTRYLFHRRTPPAAGKPHLDLLHPSRRLWRGPEGCSLAVLERQLFGLFRNEDVPGFEIPARYFAYVRGASATTLEPVLTHNRRDLLSLALIALYVGRLVEEGAGAARSGEECLGLGQLYEWLGDRPSAIACYERAARLSWRLPVRRLEAVRGAARLYRRDRRHQDAVFAWKAIADAAGDSPMTIEAVTALAVHHEHRTKDLDAAKRFATLALDARSEFRRAAAQYRLARIERKLQRPQGRLQFFGT